MRDDKVENKINELKIDVTMLVARQDMMGRDLCRIRDIVVDQQGMITDLHKLVDLLREQVLVLQHGAGNPIVIDLAREMDSDSSSEGVEVLDDDNNDVVMYYPAPQGLLVLIEDGELTAVSSAW